MQSFKTGGSVKNAYCGGGRMKKGGEVDAEDIKQDKAIVKKAIAMHDKQEHKGEKTDLSKLKRGGRSKKEVGTVKKYCGGKSVKKMSDGKSTGELPQDLTDRLAKESNKEDRELITKPARAIAGAAKQMYDAATGKGAKDYEPKKFGKDTAYIVDDYGNDTGSYGPSTGAVTSPVGGPDNEIRSLNMGKKSKAPKASDFNERIFKKRGGKC